jgi:hypothetical protein
MVSLLRDVNHTIYTGLIHALGYLSQKCFPLLILFLQSAQQFRFRRVITQTPTPAPPPQAVEGKSIEK